MSPRTRRLKRAFRDSGGTAAFFEGFKMYAACVAVGDISEGYAGERTDAEAWCDAKGMQP